MNKKIELTIAVSGTSHEDLVAEVGVKGSVPDLFIAMVSANESFLRGVSKKLLEKNSNNSKAIKVVNEALETYGDGVKEIIKFIQEENELNDSKRN